MAALHWKARKRSTSSAAQGSTASHSMRQAPASRPAPQRPTQNGPSFLVRAYRRLVRTYANARDEVSLIGDVRPLEGTYPPVAVESIPGRVMYMVYNSLPFHSAGYATRSQGLVAGVRALDFDSIIVTRLGYPQVFEKFEEASVPPREEIDGVPYIRLSADVKNILAISSRQYITLNTLSGIQAALQLRPSIVHAASNFVTGLTAIGIGRALGIPSIYEVRGLWEVTALSRDPSYADTLHYAHAVHLETKACLEADRVIAITSALKDELVRRGVPAEKIDIVPNGVDTNRFRPRPRDNALAARLGLAPEHVVIGYVGTILDYEGLDDLLRAVRICIDQGADHLRLLIVGDGAAYGACIELAHELQLERHVIFTGRVPHKEVEAYYSLIDITPFPRKALPVTEMVSPLKPFEAMAMGKCVVVSSVAALAEIVDDQRTGFIYEKGNVTALARVLSHVATDSDLRRAVGEEARRFVVVERDWRVLARRITEIYRNLTATSVP